MTKPVLGAIWAQASNGVIGRDGNMPWYAPEDLAHFKAVTLGAPVLMGRATWDSFPPRFRPLPGRTNIVMSRSVTETHQADGALWVPSLDAALEVALAEQPEKVWIIGGGSIYEQALARTDLPGVAGGRVSLVERTLFEAEVEGDTLAPALGDGWTLLAESQPLTSAKGHAIAPDGSLSPLTMRFQSFQR